jgi:hypothetical protein
MTTQLRIRRLENGCYRVDERVTDAGLYITWQGLFATPEGAQKEIDRTMCGRAYVVRTIAPKYWGWNGQTELE